VLAQTVLSRRH